MPLIELGNNGFGFTTGTQFASGDEAFVVGQVTTGMTFTQATGVTAASVLWKYSDEFNEKLPSTSSSVGAHGASFDLLHAIVIDEDGEWTGTKELFLRDMSQYQSVSTPREKNGSSIFYKDFINSNSLCIKRSPITGKWSIRVMVLSLPPMEVRSLH